MRFSEVSGTLFIQDRKRNSIPTIKTKIESQLRGKKANTTVRGNEIAFKTINIILGTGYINTNPIILRIYKEGKIVIEMEGNVLKIRWTVQLDTLYVLALYSSIVAGITASLYLSTDLMSSVSIGMAFFFLFIFLGILLIKYKLNDLIEACVYRSN